MPESEKARFEESLYLQLGNTTFERLRQILSEEKETTFKRPNFSKDSWIYEQAYELGRRDMIDDLLTLLRRNTDK